MPITAFAQALRAFKSGDLSQDELSWEIDRQLAIEKASPVALLEILKVQQVAEPLPRDAHAAIVNHLEEWPRDPTIVTGLAAGDARQRSARAGVGDILQGRFSLVALIGEGGMSRVFKAIDLRRVEAGAADPYVAVKVLTEPFSDYFGSIVALQREAHKLQTLNHRSIVRVIDCDRDGHTVFMTMEYLAGASLQKRLRARATMGFDTALALSLVSEVGDALDYAHRNGIVHGDLKPGNIIMTDQGGIKIIDFGMARFIARPEDGLIEPGTVAPKAVTLRYASPELAAGNDPQPADDVYALACIAYEALSGSHPFARDGESRLRDPLAQPAQPAGMPTHQYHALIRALAFDRKQRTPNVRQFLDEFFAKRGAGRIGRFRWAAVSMLCVALVTALVLHRVGRPHGGPSAVSAGSTVSAVATGAAGSAQVPPPGSGARDCPVCPVMTPLPAGSFQQGSAAADASPAERPQHRVVMGRPFDMGVYEITVAEFRAFALATHRDLSGCSVYDGRWQYRPEASWESPGFEQSDAHPVTCVSWDDGIAYAAWLSTRAGHTYRLPSASEWEYAARAGSEAATPWGTNAAAACVAANVADRGAAQRFPGWNAFPCDDGHIATAPVGSYRANAFGLHDMLGNVFEWTQDCWHDDYTAAPSDGGARKDGACTEHELRGGSWFTSPAYVSVAYRNRFESSYRSSTVGLRLVRDHDP